MVEVQGHYYLKTEQFQEQNLSAIRPFIGGLLFEEGNTYNAPLSGALVLFPATH
jgi:hypothetical protein